VAAPVPVQDHGRRGASWDSCVQKAPFPCMISHNRRRGGNRRWHTEIAHERSVHYQAGAKA
jgi:hypothetical protein